MNRRACHSLLHSPSSSAPPLASRPGVRTPRRGAARPLSVTARGRRYGRVRLLYSAGSSAGTGTITANGAGAGGPRRSPQERRRLSPRLRLVQRGVPAVAPSRHRVLACGLIDPYTHASHITLTLSTDRLPRTTMLPPSLAWQNLFGGGLSSL